MILFRANYITLAASINQRIVAETHPAFPFNTDVYYK